MQKLFLPLLFVIGFITQGTAQQRLLDQLLPIKTCNISIDVNPFIATTVVELEFYNDKNQEVEAYQSFQLNRGQVITDFQLELHGKYREGSIEEKWKARNAYNSIVGKRIDPAIIQMDGNNNYSLNIYPVAAKSSRKIKFTITQMMTEENLKLIYSLPLNFKSITEKFNLDIRVSKPASIPYANTGLLNGRLFSMHNEEAILSQHEKDIILNKPLSFSIAQFTNQPQICVNKQNGQTHFLMRLYPDVPRYYASKPKSINVYWDVSLSGLQRNLLKELDFLETYINENEINKATIILFNQQLQGVIAFNRVKDNFNSIRNYLLSYKYGGATQLGILNFSNVLADAVLLFSDGINSIGNAQPKLGAVQVNYITSTYNRHYQQHYEKFIGNTGGSVINLLYTDVRKAVNKIDTAENFLFKYTAGNMRIHESFPIRLGGSILLSGTMDHADNLELFYGNNTYTAKSENYFINDNQVCDPVTYKKMRMLKTYDSLMYSNQHYWQWQDMIVFGLTERVVTPQTSYLVLERIEDYIKYKIAPPKELEAACAERNYVYRSEYKIKALKQFNEQEGLETVVKNYNDRISWWSKDEPLIDLDAPVQLQQNKGTVTVTTSASSTGYSNGAMGLIAQSDLTSVKSELQEVVVTSAFGVKRTARSTSSSSQNVTGEQLNTIRQVNINNALAGKVAGLQVRSQSAAKLGAETMIRLRGENGIGLGVGALYVVDGTIMPSASDINPDDVEDVTVLQGPAAAALFGPDGSNGAIVINSKKAKRQYSYPGRWSEYKLSSTEDEDYIKDIRAAAGYELWDTYLKLEKENKMNVAFYFEMADFFFEKGRAAHAVEIMYNAIDLCQGATEGLKLAAYIYERWKHFDKAIAIYKGILSQYAGNLQVKRELALAYFQAGNFEAAVKTYYAIVTAAAEENAGNIKEQALTEMNAILALHKNLFDISYINPNLVKAIPVDLRITVETNYNYMGNIKFIEPDNSQCSYLASKTKHGGRCSNTYYGQNYTNNSIGEYTIKAAMAGKYRVKVETNNLGNYLSRIPMYVRVISFSNFHKANMDMQVSMFNLDNQYGVIELD